MERSRFLRTRSHAFAHFIGRPEPPNDNYPNLFIMARICALYGFDGKGQNGDSGHIDSKSDSNYVLLAYVDIFDIDVRVDAIFKRRNSLVVHAQRQSEPMAAARLKWY